MTSKCEADGCERMALMMGLCLAHDDIARTSAMSDCVEELAGLLSSALVAMHEAESSQKKSIFSLACGNCMARLPIPHSFGCRAENAILNAKRLVMK